MLALQAVPAAERTGPLVVDEEGVPLRRRNYQNLYRDVANAAGVPRTVWNMFARHGGVTEAHESGADLVDIGKHAQHSDLNTTNRHYIVPSVETVGLLGHGSRTGRSRTESENWISDRISDGFRTAVAEPP